MLPISALLIAASATAAAQTKPLPTLPTIPDAAALSAAASVPGVVIAEPLAATGTSAKAQAFGSGCALYLEFTVAGQAAIGQSPYWECFWRGRRELKLTEGAGLSLDQGLALAKLSGAPQVAVGTLSQEASGDIRLAYQVYDTATKKSMGEPVTATGTIAAINAQLPEMAAAITRRLGISKPTVPAAMDTSATELTALGHSFAFNAVRDDDYRTIRAATSHSAVACAFEMSVDKRRPNDPPLAADAAAALVTRLAPENTLAWAALALDRKPVLVPFLAQLREKSAANTASFLLALADYEIENKQGVHDAASKSARQELLDAPLNPEAWRTFASDATAAAGEIRRARTFGAMKPEEADFVSKAYPIWQKCEEQATTLDPLHDSAWVNLSTAAEFNGDDKVARAAMATAQEHQFNRDTMYWWAMQMFDTKWGGTPEERKQYANLAAADTHYPSIDNAIAASGTIRAAGFAAQADTLIANVRAKLEESIKAEPDKVVLHYEKGLLLRHDKSFAAAATEFGIAAKALPDNSTAQYEYAMALADAGQADASIAAYKSTLHLDPLNLQASFNLAELLRTNGDFAGAEPLLRDYLAVEPESARAHIALGEVLSATHRSDAAGMEFRKALEVRGNDTATYTNLVLDLTKAGFAEDAVRFGEEGVTKVGVVKGQEKPIINLHLALADAYVAEKRNPDALAQGRAASKIFPLNHHILLKLGDYQKLNGDLAAARATWTRIIHPKVEDEDTIAARKRLADTTTDSL